MKQTSENLDPLLRRSTVCTMLSVHRMTLHSWVKAGTFPPPLQISDRVSGWRRSTVERFLAERAAESGGA